MQIVGLRELRLCIGVLFLFCGIALAGVLLWLGEHILFFDIVYILGWIQRILYVVIVATALAFLVARVRWYCAYVLLFCVGLAGTMGLSRSVIAVQYNVNQFNRLGYAGSVRADVSVVCSELQRCLVLNDSKSAVEVYDLRATGSTEVINVEWRKNERIMDVLARVRECSTQTVVSVESAGNPLAIGLVYGDQHRVTLTNIRGKTEGESRSGSTEPW